MVSRKAHVLSLLAQHHHDLRRFGVYQYGLFGSFVRDDPHDTSDIDLLIDFAPGQKTFDNFMDLAFFLEALLGRHVDLLTPESLSPYIGPHILREVEYVTLSA